MTSIDQTFRAFTPEQAAAYAKHRGGSYPDPLYQAIIDYHRGPRRTLLDVGTGPGKVVFDLLPRFFERAFGCDTSEQMIAQAQRDAAALSLDPPRTGFQVAGGEACDTAVPDDLLGSVDVVTVAMTAHWLDLPAFYAAAAKVLRPGGSLAIWTASNLYVHPSTPNAARAQRILSDLQAVWLNDYSTPGNRLSDLAYRTLPLPWTLPSSSPEEEEAAAFKEADFVRRDWDLDGVPSAPNLPDGSAGPFVEKDETDLEDLRKSLGSASMVVRWREANPDKAGTADDCVNVTIEQMKKAVGAETRISTASSYSLLLLRRA